MGFVPSLGASDSTKGREEMRPWKWGLSRPLERATAPRDGKKWNPGNGLVLSLGASNSTKGREEMKPWKWVGPVPWSEQQHQGTGTNETLGIGLVPSLGASDSTKGREQMRPWEWGWGRKSYHGIGVIGSNIDFVSLSLQGHGYVNLFRTIRLAGITDSKLKIRWLNHDEELFSVLVLRNSIFHCTKQRCVVANTRWYIWREKCLVRTNRTPVDPLCGTEAMSGSVSWVNSSCSIHFRIYELGIGTCCRKQLCSVTPSYGHLRLVSENICSEGLKSPEIFGFDCSESWRFLRRSITSFFRNKRSC